jgi:hypothetical protein
MRSLSLVARTQHHDVVSIFPMHSLFTGLLALIASGCGGGPKFDPPVLVSGKVLLQGAPLTGGVVRFVPVKGDEARPGFGTIQPDGSFTAMTHAPDDGLIPGDYTVFVEPAEPPDKSVKTPIVIPEQYLSPANSPLKQTIEEETNSLTINLK